MTIKHIMVPYDESRASYRAFQTALEIAKENNAEISIIQFFDELFPEPLIPHWYPFQEGFQFLEKRLFKREFSKLKKEAEKHNVKLYGGVGDSFSTADSIVEFAKENEIDLIVMGSRRSRRNYFFQKLGKSVLHSPSATVVGIVKGLEGC